MDQTICPNCGSDEETSLHEDWVYEFGYSTRLCYDCKTVYKVHFKTVVTKIEIMEA